jgi:hypothetical protein
MNSAHAGRARHQLPALLPATRRMRGAERGYLLGDQLS